MSNPDPVRRFFEAVLMAGGALIAGLSGLCTLGFTIFGLADVFRYPGEALSILLLVAMVGGIPTLIGVGLFWWGRTLRRAESRPRRPDVAVFGDQPGERS